MNTSAFNPEEGNPLAILRRFARTGKAEEVCELCSVTLAPAHRHLLEKSNQKVVCACDACALLFENVNEGRFKLIPRDVYLLNEFHLTDPEWESLSLPINLAFLFRSTPKDRILAMYPSPAGATESLLDLKNWGNLVRANPVLANVQADVEALLVNRVGEARDYFLAPIDVCYELVGLIRLHWRGFSGGDKVWEEVSNFFSRLRSMGKTPRTRYQEANDA